MKFGVGEWKRELKQITRSFNERQPEPSLPQFPKMTNRPNVPKPAVTRHCQDVFAHGGVVEKAIKQVRNWLRTASGQNDIPGEAEICRRYRLFSKTLPKPAGTSDWTFKTFHSLIFPIQL